MRHVLAGALGAVLVYPAVWYGLAPEGPEAVPGAPQRTVAAAAHPSASRAKLRASDLEREGQLRTLAASRQPEVDLPVVRERPTLQELPAALGAPLEPARPALSGVSAPDAPSGAFSDVRDALGKMSELQAHAHEPDELARRVQSMEQDPEQLARLRALAEVFVELPPSRTDAYMPTREGGSTGSRSR